MTELANPASPAAPRISALWDVAGAATVLVLPQVVDSFSLFQITIVVTYAIGILGLNLLTGVSGQFSLGHGAFFALGAYAAAIFMDKTGLSYLWTLPLSAGICLVFGYLFGLPALRLKGIHLALATFSLAIAVPEILKLSVLDGVTGGVQGIVMAKPEVPLGLGAVLPVEHWLFYLTVGVGFGLYWLTRNLVESRTGRALKAIRESQVAAASMGIDTSRYKAIAFGLSAMITGVAGCLSAIVVQFVAPDSFPFQLSVTLLVGLVIGGIGSLPGALAGGVFVVFVPNLAEEVSKGLAGAIYGLILIATIYAGRKGA